MKDKEEALRRSQNPFFGELKKIQFADLSFCHFYDNNKYILNNDKQLFIHQIPIITLQGTDGLLTSWKTLQLGTNNQVRWIHFILPGYDGMDERRGQYDGHSLRICDLIQSLMKELKIKKAVFLTFSNGQLILNTLMYKFPLLVAGMVSFSGFIYPIFPVESYYLFMSNEFWKQTQYDFNKCNNDELRNICYKKSPEPLYQEGSIYQYAAYFKQLISYKCDILPLLHNNNWTLPRNIPKMIVQEFYDPCIQGQNTYFYIDKYMSQDKFEYNFDEVQHNFMRNNFKRYYEIIDFKNLSENFILLFDNENNHAVQAKRAKQIIPVLMQFLCVIEGINIQLNQEKPKL